jgi:transcriptional regulator with XRE-family HTH domain
MKKTFGERLRLERERLGLTQEQFGEMGGASRLAQFKYEHDQNVPSVEYLEKLSHAKVDAYFLLTGRRLSANQVDWDAAREAFIFVHKNFVKKTGKSFTAEQLFEVFQKLWRSMMDETYVDSAIDAPLVRAPLTMEQR